MRVGLNLFSQVTMSGWEETVSNCTAGIRFDIRNISSPKQLSSTGTGFPGKRLESAALEVFKTHPYGTLACGLVVDLLGSAGLVIGFMEEWLEAGIIFSNLNNPGIL